VIWIVRKGDKAWDLGPYGAGDWVHPSAACRFTDRALAARVAARHDKARVVRLRPRVGGGPTEAEGDPDWRELYLRASEQIAFFGETLGLEDPDQEDIGDQCRAVMSVVKVAEKIDGEQWLEGAIRDQLSAALGKVLRPTNRKSPEGATEK